MVNHPLGMGASGVRLSPLALGLVVVLNNCPRRRPSYLETGRKHPRSSQFDGKLVIKTVTILLESDRVLSSMGEQLPCKQSVGGSSPPGSTEVGYLVVERR